LFVEAEKYQILGKILMRRVNAVCRHFTALGDAMVQVNDNFWGCDM
jgi:hypothetical protein